MYTVHPNLVVSSINVSTSFGYPNILISFHANRALLWRLNAAGNKKTYLRLHVMCAICLPDFN